MGLEPGTWAFRVERSTAEQKQRGCNIIPGGEYNVPSPTRNTFITNGNPKTGTKKGNAAGNDGNPSLPGDTGYLLLYQVPTEPLPTARTAPTVVPTAPTAVRTYQVPTTTAEVRILHE